MTEVSIYSVPLEERSDESLEEMIATMNSINKFGPYYPQAMRMKGDALTELDRRKKVQND